MTSNNTIPDVGEPVVESLDVITGAGWIGVGITESGKKILYIGTLITKPHPAGGFEVAGSTPLLAWWIDEPDYSIWRGAITELLED